MLSKARRHVFHNIYDAEQVKEQSLATVYNFLVITTDGQIKSKDIVKLIINCNYKPKLMSLLLVSCRKLARGW